MKQLLLSILILAAFSATAQTDTTRVLFIGNSFTYTYDVPTLVKGLATASGLPFKFVMHAPGGISVGDTSQGTDAHMNNPVVFDLIRSDNWDFVSLQDNQGRFMRSYGVFPDTNVSKVIRGHLKIRDSVLFNHSCAHMLWFAGWGFKNGYTGISPTGKGLIDNIYANYTILRDTAGEIISPIGIAWERAMDELPGTDLWGPDEAHQSLAGSYLTASVIFTSIFRVHTEQIAYNGGLDSVTAHTLRRIAYETVMDSMEPTHLSHYIPTLTTTGSGLSASNGYASYAWYQNGVLLTTTTTNTIDGDIEGCYYVVATDATGCKARSVEQCYFPAGINPQQQNPFALYPVPATNQVYISNPTARNGIVRLTDATGRLLRTAALTAGRNSLDISWLAAGVYYMTITTNGQHYRHKLVKDN